MQHRYSALVLAVIFVLAAALPMLAQPAPTSTTDPAKVEVFLKSLEEALSIDNHLRVAQLVKYPLEAWVDGEKITIRNDSQLLAHYRQIFDKSLQVSLATAKAGGFRDAELGVSVCGGRLVVGRVSEKNATLKIVKIGEAAAR